MMPARGSACPYAIPARVVAGNGTIPPLGVAACLMMAPRLNMDGVSNSAFRKTRRLMIAPTRWTSTGEADRPNHLQKNDLNPPAIYAGVCDVIGSAAASKVTGAVHATVVPSSL